MKRFIFCALALCVAGFVSAQEKANPFTGTSPSFEARLKTLEEKRLDAAIAGEELAKAKSDQERQRLLTGRSASPLLASDPLNQPPVQLAPSKGKSKVTQPSPEPIAATPIEPLRPRAPRLIGTVSTPGGWVALVEHRAKVLNIPEGSSVDGVTATQVSQDRAVIDGVAMSMTPTMARVASAGGAPVLAGRPTAGSPATLPAAQGATPLDALDLGGVPRPQQ